MSVKQNRASLPYSVFQNFLTSRGLIDRLIRKAGLTARDTVVEIGAGKDISRKRYRMYAKR